MYGLSEKELAILIEEFAKIPQIREAIIFGSRAKGNYKPGSDIDICLKGCEIKNIIAKLSGLLNDELALPYVIDLVDFDEISNEALKEHISRIGQVIYRQNLS